MAINCGTKCAKSILLLFNLVFWISGCALLILGVWLIVEPDAGRLLNVLSPANLPPSLNLLLAYILVGLGGIILLVGFIGCCGALQESRCLLAVYFIFLVVILAAELLMAVATLLFREHVMIELEPRLVSRLHNTYGHEDHQDFTLALDYIQFKYNCCGVNGDDDYLTSRWLNETNNTDKIKNVPTTCCILKNANVNHLEDNPISIVSRVFYGQVMKRHEASQAVQDLFQFGKSRNQSQLSEMDEEPWQNPQPLSETACQDTILQTYETARHRMGCLHFIEEEFKLDTLIIIAAGLITGVLQVLGMILSICMCRNVSEDI